MQNYNHIHGEPIDISNPGNLTGTGVLKSKFFDTTAGVPTVSIPELIGVNFLGMFREDAPYDKVVALTSGKQFTIDVDGLLTFPTNFNPQERLFAQYYTGTAPIDIVEPVTLLELKNYLRIQGFGGGSPSDFTFDDILLSELITNARETVERWCGISLVTKGLRAIITNLAGGALIPCGPVNAISSFKLSDGTVVTDFKITGENEIDCPRECKMVIEYYAGYTNVPKALKIAVMKQATWDYVHRGDETKTGICEDAMFKAQPYNRNPWLA